MTEMEQEKRVSLNADVMLRRALDLKADNVLIAEFMGIVFPKLDNVIVIDNVVTKEDELQYHSSWDWLMPVVDKIESYNASVNINGLYSVFNKKVGHQVTIRIEAVEMNEGGDSAWVLEDEYLHHSDIKDSKIEAVYQSVIEFINQLKNK
jgi:hypothetical protein